MSSTRGTLVAASAVLLTLALCLGCGKGSPTRPKSSAVPKFTIADIDYVRGLYYFLYDPNLDLLQIDYSDITVYLDDFNFSNDQNSIGGRAFMDAGLTAGPTGTYGDPAVSDTTSVRGNFTVLHPVDDFDVLEMYGPRFKVIRLKRQLNGDQKLAATYRARRYVGPDALGGFFQVGGQDVAEVDGVTRRFMKLLRPPASHVMPDPSGSYSRDNLFALTRDLELKNFYQLPGQRIDPVTFQLTIRQGVGDPPVTSIPLGDGTSVPYIEVLGLDSYDQSTGTPVPGHDGKVDWTYFLPGSAQALVDVENGILFLPDLRPFAPRIGDAYRVSAGGAPLFPFDQALSNVLVRRDSLVGSPQSANAANVAIYDKHDAQRALDTVYYIDVQFTAARGTGGINLGRWNLLESQ